MLTFVVFLSLFLFASTTNQWHTSQLALTKLYDLQNEHFDVINNYLELETKRLEDFKSDLDVIHKWQKCINGSYLLNHVNTLKMMKQIYYQLRKIEDLMSNVQSTEVLKIIDKHKDLSGNNMLTIHQAMRRLQRFYMISASEMTAGKHGIRNIGDKMNACECLVMLKYCFEEQDMYCVWEWAVEAYKKWKNHGQPKCVDIKKLYFYIISSSVYTGFDFRHLLNSNVLHWKDRNHFDITEKFKHFFLIIHKDVNLLNRKETLNMFGTYEPYYSFRNRVGEFRFRELCKYGAPIRKLTEFSKCRYQTNNISYRILMPFKEEDINSDPHIKIFHDVLYDEEILTFKKSVSPRMQDAKVINAKESGNLLIEDTRSGQVNWVYEARKSVDDRIESFFGYSTKGAEAYQIVNYGLGGHYVPHSDVLGSRKNKEFGDRMVTVLFYMNDVLNDGYTVFPLLDIIVPVEKGSALVWLNLDKSNGSKLHNSLHGSCPLLKGNKWIMTRWLTEENQPIPYDWRKNLKV